MAALAVAGARVPESACGSPRLDHAAALPRSSGRSLLPRAPAAAGRPAAAAGATPAAPPTAPPAKPVPGAAAGRARASQRRGGQEGRPRPADQEHGAQRQPADPRRSARRDPAPGARPAGHLHGAVAGDARPQGHRHRRRDRQQPEADAVAVPEPGGIHEGAGGARHDARASCGPTRASTSASTRWWSRGRQHAGADRRAGARVLRQESRQVQAGRGHPREPHPDSAPTRRPTRRRRRRRGPRPTPC